MANEVVKHHNDLNTVIMRKWTAEEMNFFLRLLQKQEIKTLLTLFSININWQNWQTTLSNTISGFYDTMDSLANNISQLRYIEKTKNSIEYMPLLHGLKLNGKMICQTCKPKFLYPLFLSIF